MKKKIIIIAIIVFLLLALGVGGYFIFGNKDKKDDKTKSNSKSKTTITITFDAAGGTEVEPMKVKKGEKFELPKTEKKGYFFQGWFDGEVYYSDEDTDKLEKDTTLKALWANPDTPEDDVELKILFDSKGGSKVKDMTFKCSDGVAILKNLPKSKKDSYDFLSWEDKHGKSILDGAKIMCDGSSLKLYAVWEYDGPVANPSKSYKCPTGYTLDGTSCITYGTVSEKCPDGTKIDGSLCIKTSDFNSGTRVCKSTTVSIDGKGHTWTGTGDYHFANNSYGKCAYYKWDSYTSKSACEAAYDVYHRTVWVSDLNACYAEDKMNNYETKCSDDYKYYSSAELSSKFGIHNDGRCLRKVSKVKYCSDGYNLKNDKCVKTVDATLE